MHAKIQTTLDYIKAAVGIAFLILMAPFYALYGLIRMLPYFAGVAIFAACMIEGHYLLAFIAGPLAYGAFAGIGHAFRNLGNQYPSGGGYYGPFDGRY